jgi:hypothetical protein
MFEYNYYSIFSHLENRYPDYDELNENIEIVIPFKKEVSFLRENRINYCRLLNYIPLDIFKDTVVSLFDIYLKEYQYGTIEKFINNFFGMFIFECKEVLDVLERGKLKFINDSEDDFYFYYYGEAHNLETVCWSKEYKDYYYETYLIRLLEFLNMEIFEYYKNSKIPQVVNTQNITLLKDITDETNKLNLEDLFREQNNLTTKLSVEDVYKHFVVLTTKTNRNNQFYLTNDQLLKFVHSTFILQKPEKQKFNCKPIVKKDVRKIFFSFYEKNKNKETNQTALKQKYFNIMNDAFEGFNDNDNKDFHRV